MYKIMLVEDEDKIRALVGKELEKWGYTVYAPTDWGGIFDAFMREHPALVLMDINLPLYDGFYWCSRIRQVSKVPVMFLSSRGENMDIVMAVSMGGDDYLTKPFGMEVLMAKVNALLRRSYAYNVQPLGTVEHGGALLSSADNTLLYRDQKVELTRNEYKILWVLMQNSQSIVSREKLMKELWDDESFIDDNTLTVNVNRLRRKIAGIGLNDYIKTIKNQGYSVQ